MRTPSTPQPHSLGHVVEHSSVTVFFGDARAERAAVARAFPDYHLILINQTHSDVVVSSPKQSDEREADAHFTTERKLALGIRTADCLPVMIHDPESGIVASIHAGWRGVENEIIRKTCLRLKKEGATLDSARAWIGPHIMSASFEVGRDVAEKLEARFQAVRSYANGETALRPHENQEKARVDLLMIARAQLAAHGIRAERMTTLEIDTVTSPNHASHRRDKERAGRQISFIALK